MRRKIDEGIGQRFAIAAGVLMTRVFSTPLEPNERRCAFVAGPESDGARVAPCPPGFKFDLVGLGFVAGREWDGPTEVFVEEMRGGENRTWNGCRFWADSFSSPIYLLTRDPDVCFSFDGNSLVPLTGQPDNVDSGVALARLRLRQAALRAPNDVEKHRMM